MTNARVSSTHLQALVSPSAQARVSAVQLQVLMPTLPPAAQVSGIEMQVLLSWPQTVSTYDGTTPIQVFHTDSVWRPLQMIF